METIVLKGNVDLKKPLIVQAGQQLYVAPGTQITCYSQKFPTAKETIENSGLIIGAAGCIINMDGNNEQPIVVKGDGDVPTPGTWAGIHVCSFDTNTPASVLEGFTVEEVGEEVYNALRYGDWVELEGRFTKLSMKFVEINGAGLQVDQDRELNALTLCGVNAQNLNNLVVKNSADDGIEVFSGRISGSNWLIENALDDALDIDQGGVVNVANLLISQPLGQTDIEMGNKTNKLGGSFLSAFNVVTNGAPNANIKDNAQLCINQFSTSQITL